MSNRGRFFLLLFLTLARNTKPLFAQPSAVQVQVYDFAGLSAAAMRQFVPKIQEILSSSGVSLEVDACPRAGGPCEGRAGSSRQIVIRIIADGPAKQKNVDLCTLGQSIAGPDGGTYATIYLKSAENEASEANLPRTVVLAYAAAHEIGHLLLGNQAHSSRGLMKAVWRTSDFQAMAQNDFHFSPEQAKELTGRFGPGSRADATGFTAIAVRE